MPAGYWGPVGCSEEGMGLVHRGIFDCGPLFSTPLPAPHPCPFPPGMDYEFRCMGFDDVIKDLLTPGGICNAGTAGITISIDRILAGIKVRLMSSIALWFPGPTCTFFSFHPAVQLPNICLRACHNDHPSLLCHRWLLLPETFRHRCVAGCGPHSSSLPPLCLHV
jgi:hypothetical protein